LHEYALTKRIVNIINETAAAHGAKKVNAAWLIIGENAGIILDSVQLYYDAIARGTPAGGARLHVRAVRAEMYCPACGKNFERPRFSFACPDCGGQGKPAGTGGECYVERVELDL